jgi:dipeptidyl aminopeptidase/acylaminoacyl peptidase
MRCRLIPFLFLFVLPALAAPPAPDDLAAAVERMTRVSSSYAPSLSPDGREVAFLSNRSGVPQAWIAAVEKGGEPRRLGSFEDPVTGIDWSPDGQWIALSVAPGGGLNEQIYLVHPDGSGLQRITSGGRENNVLDGWSERFLRYGSAHDGPGAVEPWIWDSATGKSRKISSNSGVATLTDVSRDGRRAVVGRLASRGDDNLFLIDLATGKEELLTPHDPPGNFGGGRFSPDGATVYLTSNKDLDKEVFAKVVIGPDGKPGPIQQLASRDDAEVDGFEITEDGTQAVLIFNAAGRSELERIDLRSLQRSPVRNLPGEILGGLDFSRDGKLLAFTAGGAKLPTDIRLLDMGSGSIRQVTFSPHEGVELSTLISPELVRFPAHDGLELTGWLYRPVGAAGPGSVVISFHGGPEGQERPNFNATYQALLSRGIGVFAPNVRGSAGFGKRFVNLDNGPLRVEAVKDIKDCADFLVRQRIADPRRIGIMGGSYGGYMTVAGLVEYPDLFAAGADLFGIVNFETFFSHTEPWMAAVSTKEYGDPATQKEMLRQLSPITRLDRVKAPLLVLHGENDTNVPVVEARQVAEQLRKRGVPVEAVFLPGEGHGFRKLPNRVRATTEIVRWFERYLKPAAQAAP